MDKKIEHARAQGRFEGEVLTGLKDIKLAIGDIKEEVGNKVDKEDFVEVKAEVKILSRWRWISTGAGGMIGWFLSNLS